ncbi:MAG: hypothetical protein WC907_05025, partial [Acholeplasmataceae bacterium]
YCYLVTDELDNERLNLLKNIDDGFTLAAYDLKLRGPGIFSGIIQTGKYNFKYLDFSSDLNILQNIKKDVIYYLNNIDKYSYLLKIIKNT